MNKKIWDSLVIIILAVVFVVIIFFPKNEKSDSKLIKEYIEHNDMCNNNGKNSYIKDNVAYIHCIGEKGNIIKYINQNKKVNKEVLELDYSDTPNISQLHITIDKVDSNYIYLKSTVKVNDSVKNGEYVKCSLSSKKCEYYNKREIANVENVSISISNISLTGATITITDTNEKPYVYGEWYEIEKEDNGEWFALKTKIENYGFNELGYEIDKNNEVKFVIDWEQLYGELPSGSYRIVKQVNNQYIYVDFGIATTS